MGPVSCLSIYVPVCLTLHYLKLNTPLIFFIMVHPRSASSVLFFILLLLSNVNAIRLFLAELEPEPEFMEAPDYRNGFECCHSVIHVAMTLDPDYLRGTIAAVHSILKHTSCPENVFLHFIASTDQQSLKLTVQSTFPSLVFSVYAFDESVVSPLISTSIREALDDPLNYARNYLADILDPAIERVIYLDSDVLVVDDIRKLWNMTLRDSRVVGAPEYCHANFTKYFTSEFWSDPEFASMFDGKRPCYFNTGVMVMDLGKWRAGGFTDKIEAWMRVQKERRIYDLGSLPPFLLVFGGEVEGVDHRWNQHGLGGDNLANSCRALHPGPVSLLHWSGKGKPWTRLDNKVPCPVDYLWAPYDLQRYLKAYSL